MAKKPPSEKTSKKKKTPAKAGSKTSRKKELEGKRIFQKKVDSVKPDSSIKSELAGLANSASSPRDWTLFSSFRQLRKDWKDVPSPLFSPVDNRVTL